METPVSDGQILEFHGEAGDRLVLSANALTGREFLTARYARGGGPYPQFGKSWSTAACLCLGNRAPAQTSRNTSAYYSRGPRIAPPAVPVATNDVIFEEAGVILVEYPPKGEQFGAIIERVDAGGNRHAPDGVRTHWVEDESRRV